MPAKKLGLPPTFDEATFAKRLHERVLTTGGKQYAVFQEKYFPAFSRWLKGTVEYDGTGVRDVVNANAQFLDDVKGHLDLVDARESQHHAAQAQRLTALEEAVGNPPFPG